MATALFYFCLVAALVLAPASVEAGRALSSVPTLASATADSSTVSKGTGPTRHSVNSQPPAEGGRGVCALLVL